MSEPRQRAEQATAALAKTLGGGLRAALLYGSAARGEHIDGVSDVNVLFLLDDIDADTLRRASPALRPHAEAGLAPLLLEWREWRRASDVFAIELLDMRDAHALLHGEDPLTGLDVAPDRLRLQAERELRSRLILLHDGMLRAAEDPDRLGLLLAAALPAFVTYLRAALRLAGRTVPASMREVVQQGAELVGAAPDGLLRALEARQARAPWSVPITDPVVDRYNQAAEKTATFVDTFGRQAP
jgi:predicted nucleotidyltransferase